MRRASRASGRLTMIACTASSTSSTLQVMGSFPLSPSQSFLPSIHFSSLLLSISSPSVSFFVLSSTFLVTLHPLSLVSVTPSTACTATTLTRPRLSRRVCCGSWFRLKPLDIQAMKYLHNRVNIVPVIAKADTLTRSELKALKTTVRLTRVASLLPVSTICKHAIARSAPYFFM